MDFRQLQTFVVAAQTEHFHKTAEQLYLAQPTVTQHIRQLEKELGIKLFVRVGKRVKLTDEGKRFLTVAQSLLDQWNQGLEEMHAWRQGYHETLRVAVSPIIARTSLPGLIRTFTKSHPEVDVSIRIAESVTVGALVQNGEAEIGLSRIIPGEFGLSIYQYQQEPVVFVISTVGENIDTPSPDWEEEISRQRLLTHNHPGYWDELLLRLRQRGISFRSMRVSQVDITKRFIEEGLGVSFLPKSAVTRELIENRLLEVDTPGLPLPMVASYAVVNGTLTSRPAAQLLEILAHQYSSFRLIKGTSPR